MLHSRIPAFPLRTGERSHAFWASPPGRMEQRAGRAAVTHEDHTDYGGETRAPGIFLTLEITFIRFSACFKSISALLVMSWFTSSSYYSTDGGGVWFRPSKSSGLPPVKPFWHFLVFIYFFGFFFTTWTLQSPHHGLCTLRGDGFRAEVCKRVELFVPEWERLRTERPFLWIVHCAGQRADLHHRGRHPGQCPRHPVRVQEQETQECRWETN